MPQEGGLILTRNASVMVAAALLLLAEAGTAQDSHEGRSVRVESFVSEVVIAPDRSATVTETIRVRFMGRWNGFQRFIPVPRVPWVARDEYLDFLVAEDDEGVPLRVWEGQTGGSREIVISLPGAEDVHRTLVLSYILPRVVGTEGDLDYLRLQVTGRQWALAIDSVAVSVHSQVPALPEASLLLVHSDGQAEEVEVGAWDGALRAEGLGPLPSGSGFTVTLEWPGGAFDDVADADALLKAARRHWLLLSGLGLALVISLSMTRRGLPAPNLPKRDTNVSDVRSGLVVGVRTLTSGVQDLALYTETRRFVRGRADGVPPERLADPWTFDVQKTLLAAVPAVLVGRMLVFVYSPDVVPDPRLKPRDTYFAEILPDAQWAIAAVAVPLALLLLAPLIAVWISAPKDGTADRRAATQQILYLDGAFGLLPQAALAVGLVYAIWIASTSLDPAGSALGGVTLVVWTVFISGGIGQAQVLFGLIPHQCSGGRGSSKHLYLGLAFTSLVMACVTWLLASHFAVIVAFGLATVKALVRGEL